MPSDKSFAAYIADQASDAGVISTRSMMGEFMVYCDGVYTAIIADNRVYVKATEAGRAFIGTPVEGQPYPGAKPCFDIGTRFEDSRWFSHLIRISRQELESKPTGKSRKK